MVSKRNSISIFIIFLIVIIIFIAVALSQRENTNNGESSSNIGAPKSEITVSSMDFSLKTLDGQTVTLSSYHKGLAVINFWAVWCKYCVLEMPDLVALDKELRAADLGVVIAVDVAEEESTVKNYLSSKGFSSLLVPMDYDGKVAKKFNVSGYPTTFVFYNGKLVDKFGGMMSKQDMQSIKTKAENGTYQ
jgi:thiol-disulfide isomerase/thioredoxin